MRVIVVGLGKSGTTGFRAAMPADDSAFGSDYVLRRARERRGEPAHVPG